MTTKYQLISLSPPFYYHFLKGTWGVKQRFFIKDYVFYFPPWEGKGKLQHTGTRSTYECLGGREYSA